MKQNKKSIADLIRMEGREPGGVVRIPKAPAKGQISAELSFLRLAQMMSEPAVVLKSEKQLKKILNSKSAIFKGVRFYKGKKSRLMASYKPFKYRPSKKK